MVVGTQFHKLSVIMFDFSVYKRAFVYVTFVNKTYIQAFYAYLHGSLMFHHSGIVLEPFHYSLYSIYSSRSSNPVNDSD